MRKDLGPEKTKFGEFIKTPTIEYQLKKFPEQGKLRWAILILLLLSVVLPYMTYYVVLSNYEHLNSIMDLDALGEELLKYYRQIGLLNFIEQRLIERNPENPEIYRLHGYVFQKFFGFSAIAAVILISAIFKYKFLILNSSDFRDYAFVRNYTLLIILLIFAGYLTIYTTGYVHIWRLYSKMNPFTAFFLNFCLLVMVLFNTSCWLQLNDKKK